MTDLREVLHDAVVDVEPADRLAEIRARTSAPRRTAGWAVGGTLLAVAATVVAAVALSIPGDGSDDPSPAGPTTTESSGRSGPAYAVYFVGDTARGPRLFREWRKPGPMFPDGLSALSGAPRDDDYTTLWLTAGLRLVGEPTDGVATVQVADGLFAERPEGVSDEEARLGVQQVVATVRAAHPDVDTVEFAFDTRSADAVLGLPGPDFDVAPEAEVRASVNISDPVEGRVVSGSFTARGSAHVPDSTVHWELRQGSAVVGDGYASAPGSGDQHQPWETVIDLTGVAPGTYTLAVAGAGEGAAPDVDTRTVVVE